MEKHTELLRILENEVKPSYGCSGPIGAAIAACEAANAVGGKIKSINALIDKDMCTKNSDVGIPPVGIKGMRNALLIGALCGKTGKGLDVLADTTNEEIGSRLQGAGDITVTVSPDWECEAIGVYTDVSVETDQGIGRAIVAKSHSNLVYLEANGNIIINKPHDRNTVLDESNDPVSKYLVSDLYEFSDSADITELEFLREAIEMNKQLSEYGLNDEHDNCVFGKSLLKQSGDDFVKKAKAITAAAAEARMNGGALPAMSCATSGNAGITASMPLYSIADSKGIGEEKLLRALALAYLVTISVKNKIGRHSAMCACVCGAAPGVAAGTAYLLGGDENVIHTAIQNTLVNIFGVLCDGARQACALKLSSAAATAIDGALMSLDGISAAADEGILGRNADESIAFLGDFARNGMKLTDLMLCRALYAKHF